MERILDSIFNYFGWSFPDFMVQINISKQIEMITKTFLYLINLVIIWMSPIKGALIFAILLVFIDTITGIMKAGKSDVEKINSNSAFRIVPKVIFYALMIIVCQALNNYVDGQVPWVKLALVGIGWIEIKSIDENFKDIFGYSFIDKILEGMKSIKKIEKK
jgi:phage-related holin